MRRRRRGGELPAPRTAQEEAELRQVELHIAPLRLCTDNAVMGAIAVERWKAGRVEALDLDVFPGVVRMPQAEIFRKMPPPLPPLLPRPPPPPELAARRSSRRSR